MRERERERERERKNLRARGSKRLTDLAFSFEVDLDLGT